MLAQDKGIIHVGKQGGVFSKDTLEQNFEFLCDFYATLAPVIPPLNNFKAGPMSPKLHFIQKQLLHCTACSTRSRSRMGFFLRKTKRGSGQGLCFRQRSILIELQIDTHTPSLTQGFIDFVSGIQGASNDEQAWYICLTHISQDSFMCKRVMFLHY